MVGPGAVLLHVLLASAAGTFVGGDAECVEIAPDTASCTTPDGDWYLLDLTNSEATEEQAPEESVGWLAEAVRLEWSLAGTGGSTRATDSWGGAVGVEGRFGVRWTRPFDERSLNGDVREGALCAPFLLCGVAGIGLVPRSAFVGNELGVELAVGSTWSWHGGEPRRSLRLGIKPTLATARSATVRVPSFVGALLPEVGVEWIDGSAARAYLAWSPYQVGFRLGRRWAVSLDVARVGVLMSRSNEETGVRVGTALSLDILWSPDDSAVSKGRARAVAGRHWE